MGRQAGYGVKKRHPQVGRLASAQMRFIIAGESAGAWGMFGGIGLKWANLHYVFAVGVTTNQATAARLMEARNAECQQTARGRRDPTQTETQLTILRATDGQRRDCNPRCADEHKGAKPFTIWGPQGGKGAICGRRRKEIATLVDPAGTGSEETVMRKSADVAGSNFPPGKGNPTANGRPLKIATTCRAYKSGSMVS